MLYGEDAGLSTEPQYKSGGQQIFTDDMFTISGNYTKSRVYWQAGSRLHSHRINQHSNPSSQTFPHLFLSLSPLRKGFRNSILKARHKMEDHGRSSSLSAWMRYRHGSWPAIGPEDTRATWMHTNEALGSGENLGHVTPIWRWVSSLWVSGDGCVAGFIQHN